MHFPSQSLSAKCILNKQSNQYATQAAFNCFFDLKIWLWLILKTFPLSLFANYKYFFPHQSPDRSLLRRPRFHSSRWLLNANAKARGGNLTQIESILKARRAVMRSKACGVDLQASPCFSADTVSAWAENYASVFVSHKKILLLLTVNPGVWKL